MLVLGCGVRPRAASRLKWDEIDFEQKIIRTVGEKRKDVARPISDWAMKELEALRTASKSASTVVGFAEVTIIQNVKRIREKLKMPLNVSLRGLRKTFVNRLYRTGVSPQIAAKLAGHSVQTAQRYYVDFGSLNVKDALANLDFGDKTSSKSSAK